MKLLLDATGGVGHQISSHYDGILSYLYIYIQWYYLAMVDFLAIIINWNIIVYMKDMSIYTMIFQFMIRILRDISIYIYIYPIIYPMTDPWCWYPLLNVNSLLLKMAIEIVDLPIKKGDFP